MQQKPAFYFVLNNLVDKVTFFCSIPKEYSKSIDLKALSADLGDKYNLRGGGSNLAIQGGGPKTDFLELKKELEKWLK